MWYKSLKHDHGLFSNLTDTPGVITLVRKDFQYAQMYPKELFEYIELKTSLKDKNLHEIVLSSMKQKLKIDIDATTETVSSGPEMRNAIVRSLLKVLEDVNIKLNLEDLLIFDSSGGNVLSYHIIVPNYHFQSSECAKVIAQRVAKEAGEYGRYVDLGVYKSIQSFRLMGCAKAGSSRVKTYLSQWVYSTESQVEVEKVEKGSSVSGSKTSLLSVSLNSSNSSNSLSGTKSQGNLANSSFIQRQVNVEPRTRSKLSVFLSSLLSYITSDSVEMPLFKPDLLSKSISFVEYEASEHSEAVYQAIVDQFIGPNIFEVSSIVDNEVILIRLEPSLCPICNRVHENDNAKLIITEKGNLKYFCWRSPSARVFIDSGITFDNTSLLKTKPVNATLEAVIDLFSELDLEDIVSL